ncbi:MAG: metallophosphoesterase [Chitinivibrionales bacterium]|nr:metallophosphoesterase [Chitinivibrionales bacterium]
MKILFIGDVFGNTGRRILSQFLGSLRSEHTIDICIANGENAAGGKGLTGNLYKKLRSHGVDVLTGGNHSFTSDNALDNQSWPVLRPFNFPPGNIGRGHIILQIEGGRQIAILNLIGRTYFNETVDCPFRAAEDILKELREETATILVDFHAEASSEKRAMFHFLNGKVSALVGTHTHIQTADECISTKGTAYITDAGMTGPEDSCIGMKANPVIQKFLLQTPAKFEPATRGPMINAVVIETDDETGRATAITRIYNRVTLA